MGQGKRRRAITAGGEPDSWRAWLACVLSLLVLFVAFGLAYSYGVFFSPITQTFGTGRGQAATFFSVTSLLFFGLGSVTGPLSDRVGPRPLLVCGGLAIAAGLFGTARAGTLWQAYAAYGLGVGIGVGCVYVPVVAAVGRWFERRRASALGLAVSGIGLGTLVVAPLSAWLIEACGWRAVYTGYAAVAALVLPLAGVLFPQPPPAPPRQAGETRAHASGGFVRLYVATLCLNVVLYVPFVHLPPAAEDIGITPLRAAGLVGVIGVASVVGRLLIGAQGDRHLLAILYKACFLLVTVSLPVWALADGYAGLLVFAVLIGTGYGGYIALTPAVLARLFGPRDLGRLLGRLYTAVALGAAAGPLAVGAAADRLGGYTEALMALLAVAALGTCLILPLASSRRRPAPLPPAPEAD